MANGVRTRATSLSGKPSRSAVKPGNTSRTSTPSAANAGGNAAMTSPSPPVLTHGNSSAAACSTRVGGPATSLSRDAGEGLIAAADVATSVLALVHESVLLDPRHHRPQPLAD